MSDTEIEIFTIETPEGDKDFVLFQEVEVGKKILLALIPKEAYDEMEKSVFVDFEALKVHILLVYKDGMVRVINEREIQDAYQKMGIRQGG